MIGLSGSANVPARDLGQTRSREGRRRRVAGTVQPVVHGLRCNAPTGGRSMRVGYDEDEERQLASDGRMHPYAVSANDPRGRYYNFREHPDLIDKVLEDFIPFAGHAAVQRFYEMLRWANGSISNLETSDCFLQPPTRNKSSEIRALNQICGRLTFHLRDYTLNVQPAAIDWLCGTFERRLQDKDKKFQLGALSYSRFPVQFTELLASGQPCVGSSVAVKFWAWGNGQDDVFKNLDRVFERSGHSYQKRIQRMGIGYPRLMSSSRTRSNTKSRTTSIPSYVIDVLVPPKKGECAAWIMQSLARLYSSGASSSSESYVELATTSIAARAIRTSKPSVGFSSPPPPFTRFSLLSLATTRPALTEAI